MLTMGLTLTTNDFKILAQRPLDVFIGACAQFIIMPGVAYTLVQKIIKRSAMLLQVPIEDEAAVPFQKPCIREFLRLHCQWEMCQLPQELTFGCQTILP